MNELNENLNFYSSYCPGVQDIFEFKSTAQAALGVCKFLLGSIFVVPIIFGVGYLITQYKLYELTSLCNRVSKALSSNTEQLTQNDLITFLSKNVLDQDNKNDDFEAAFQRLDSTSQKMFFDSMADKGKLADSLTNVPKGIREINIGFGQNPASEMIDKTILQLCTFKQLHTITFDLSQTTHLTNGINGLIKKSIGVIKLDTLFAYGSKESFDLCDDRYYESYSVIASNNSLPASRIIHGVVYHLIKESALAHFNFSFKINPGELRPVYIANPFRTAKISEEDSANASKKNPLNFNRPSEDAPDIWYAVTEDGLCMPTQ